MNTDFHSVNENWGYLTEDIELEIFFSYKFEIPSPAQSVNEDKNNLMITQQFWKGKYLFLLFDFQKIFFYFH